MRNEITWSPQQTAFLDFVEHGTGSCVLEAVAGAGKSTTIVEAATRAEGTSILICYNTAPAKELQDKLNERGINWKKARASTVHSAGVNAYKRTFPNWKLDERKVSKLVEQMCQTTRDENGDELPKEKQFLDVLPYAPVIVTLVSHAKNRAFGIMSEIENRAAWFNIIEHFDVLGELEADERRHVDADRLVTAAIEALKRNNAITESIDYDDMIYMPLIHKVSFFWHDNVFVDEAQDTNAARRAIVRSLCKKRGGRVFAVGDRCQAIYGFTGADADSLDLIKQDFNAIELPLSVSYRCPQDVVRFARSFGVEHIEPAESAPVGYVGEMKLADFLASASTAALRSDAVLCRNTKPLVQLAFRLIKQGVACKVEGRDIGNGLIALATKWDAIKTLSALSDKLEEYKDREVSKAMAKKKETKAQSVADQVETLQVIIGRCRQDGGTRIQGLVEYISETFADDVKGILRLSTIHKAKGREWNRVYWLDREGTCPSFYARQEWQHVQERNLMYVAATRAKAELIEIGVPRNQNITAKDIQAEIELTQRRISFMVLSDHDRERAEEYLIELYVQRDLIRRTAEVCAPAKESRP
jgi:DNA helicase-2/ATP-dependent DNA helicase PcrA